MLLYAFGQKRVVARPFGLNHAVIFWAFMILLVANCQFLVFGLFPGVSMNALPDWLHHAMLFAFDAVSLLALVSVIVAVLRRLFFAPDYLGTTYTSPRSPEALLILSSIALLMVAYFGLHGALIAMGNEASAYMPVSSLVTTL